MALLSKKIAHLLPHFSPSPGRIVVENEANDRQEQEDQRGEREHRLVGKRSSQLRYFIFEPFRKCLLQQTD